MNVKLNLKKVVGVLVGCALAGTVLSVCGTGGDTNKSSGGKIKGNKKPIRRQVRMDEKWTVWS